MRPERTALIALICIIFSFCCKSKSSPETEGLTYRHQHVIPTSGKYYLTIQAKNNTSFSYEDKSTESSNSTSIGMFYEFSRDSAGLPQLKLTYEEINIELESSKTGKQSFSTDNVRSPSEMSQLLSLLKGRSITIHYDSTGKAGHIEGAEDAINAALSAIPQGATDMRKAVRDQLNGFVGGDFIKNNLEPVGQLFPDSSVRTGDKWNKELIQRGGVPFHSQSQFTVTSLKNKIAVLELESTVDSKQAIPLDIAGYKLNAKLTGNQVGEFRTEMETGLLTSAHTTTKMDGNIEIVGKAVPVTIRIDKDIKLEKR